MFDKKYYEVKLQKLQTKSNANLQKFITSAFDMVSEAQDINERITEIQELLKAEPKGVKEEIEEAKDSKAEPKKSLKKNEEK